MKNYEYKLKKIIFQVFLIYIFIYLLYVYITYINLFIYLYREYHFTYSF